MRKLICFIFVILLAYVGVGLAFGLYFSEKIEKERRGIRVSIAAVKADQLRVSELQREITGRTLGVGQTKVDEMREMLADSELNRLALSYIGNDWAAARSDFLAHVSKIHKRDSARRNKACRLRNEWSELEKKIKELENRKRSLSHQLRSPRAASDEKNQVAKAEIDRQLLEMRNRLDALRVPSTEGELLEVGNAHELDIMIVKCRKETVEALKEKMLVELKKLGDEGVRVSSTQTIFCWFDVWPVNWLVRFVREGGDVVQ